MTDPEKTLERLEKHYNKFLGRWDDPSFDEIAPHALLVIAKILVRQEMREEAHSGGGLKQTRERLRKRGFTGTMFPNRPTAEPRATAPCPECLELLDNAGRCQATHCPRFESPPAESEKIWIGAAEKLNAVRSAEPSEVADCDPKECEHVWHEQDDGFTMRCSKCPETKSMLDLTIPQPPEDK